MSFRELGYEIVNIDDYAVRAAIVGLSCDLGALEEYSDGDVDRHARASAKVADIPRVIIGSHLGYFQRLLGSDIHIQSKPFLRISRPGAADDNIGFHRDTWYGDTPYEISVWIPFTDTDEGNALRVAPGSHIWSEATHPVERFDRPDVQKGSTKHSLGFIYSPPKRLAHPVEMLPLPVCVGQMIVFSLALLHGQEVNRSTRTRVSMDVRLANSLAPVKFCRSRDPDYYQPLCTSPVTEAAQRYYEANK